MRSSLSFHKLAFLLRAVLIFLPVCMWNSMAVEERSATAVLNMVWGSFTHLFTHCLRLLSCHSATCHREHISHLPKILTVWSFTG